MPYQWIILLLQVVAHQWVLVENRFWQIAGKGEDPQDISQGECPKGMIHVKGNMLQDRDPNPFGTGTVEYLQKTTCTKWINKEFPERCQIYDREAWLNITKTLKRKPMEFCMDQYEAPGRKGAYPVIFINFNEAQEMCNKWGKRLCSESEWTFACEGEEGMPYPYGYERSKEKCVIDKPYIPYRPSGLRNRTMAFIELNRLWQGEPSGSRSECKSVWGVYDLTGNVDEWTTKVYPHGKYKSILRGGAWVAINRNRCRPSTRGHNENHIFYQQGFRCCKSLQ